jgi:hypothetical protein
MGTNQPLGASLTAGARRRLAHDQTKGRTMTDQNKQAEAHLEHGMKVRQVTNIQASWTEVERGEEGMFTVQLIPRQRKRPNTSSRSTPTTWSRCLTLFKLSDYATFDMDRKVLMFGTLKVK